jgi:hypothetical protein
VLTLLPFTVSVLSFLLAAEEEAVKGEEGVEREAFTRRMD